MVKKYAVHTDHGDVVSIEVDGQIYDSPEQIEDPADREKVEALLRESSDESFEAEFDRDFEEFDRKFHEHDDEVSKMPLYIGLVFLSVALVMMAVAVITALSSLQAQAKEVSATGEVVDLVVRRSAPSIDSQGTPIPPQDYYYPKVSFTTADGVAKTVQLAEGSWPPAYEKGEQVTVLYDPARPLNARIKSDTSDLMMWIVPGITGTLGLIFLIVAVLVLRSYKPVKKQEPYTITPA